jgi:tyrosinase
MKASILLCAAATAAAASLPTRQTSGPDFVSVPYEEALQKYSKLFKPNTPEEIGSDFTAASAAATCSRSLRVRKEWRTMTTSDQKSWLTAVNCLMDKPSRTNDGQSLWEDLAWIHALYLNSIHGIDRFFPWHREFVQIYENLIRKDCGYAGPLPWWDETLDAGKFSKSPIFSSSTFGSLSLGPDTPKCVTNGAFAGRKFGIDDTCLARAGDDKHSTNITEAYITLCNAATNFHDFAECNERGVHNLGHESVGATLRSSSTAPLEPLFFLHHTFVDRIWWRWQNKNPARFSTISGCTIPVFPCPSDSYLLAPDSYLGGWDGLSNVETVGEILDTRNEHLCYTYDR